MKVGVVGLGSMGYGIAASLIRSGHEVFGADVNPEAIICLRAEGGSQEDITSAASELDAVIVVVLNAAQAEKVLFGQEGLVARLSPGAVVILSVTVAPDYARSSAERCDARGLHFLDAPISGGADKAAQGKLSIMASGAPDAFSRHDPFSTQWPKRSLNWVTLPARGPQ